MRKLALLMVAAIVMTAAVAQAQSLTVRDVLRQYASGKPASVSELKMSWRQSAQLYVNEVEAVLYLLPGTALGRSIAADRKIAGECRRYKTRLICHDEARDAYYVYEPAE